MGNAAGTPGAPASRIIEGALNHSGWLEEEMNGGGSAAVLTELNPGLQVRDFVQSFEKLVYMIIYSQCVRYLKSVK